MKKIILNDKNKELMDQLRSYAENYGMSVVFYHLKEAYGLDTSNELNRVSETLNNLKNHIDTLLNTSDFTDDNF